MVMNLSEETIKDIARELDCGMECYVHKQTGEVVKFPDRDQWLGDEEFWEEEVEKVETNPDDYYRIDKMPSRDAYIVMEAFVETVDNNRIQQSLSNAIAGRKPFAAFNAIIHQLGYEREAWFAHKQAAMEEWVKQQLR